MRNCLLGKYIINASCKAFWARINSSTNLSRNWISEGAITHQTIIDVLPFSGIFPSRYPLEPIQPWIHAISLRSILVRNDECRCKECSLSFHRFHSLRDSVCIRRTSVSHWRKTYNHRRRLWGQPERAAPNIWKTSKHLPVFTTFPPKSGFRLRYFDKSTPVPIIRYYFVQFLCDSPITCNIKRRRYTLNGARLLGCRV